ncbi:hypothetical protein FJY68_12080 [candidate division WOR-3 bacterium]|uniref:Uncharacterized protein n=1 Tax=candidate division WOR-3 bacterium TaxID=2052148 RepID=A0A938BV10_UNCW3|nr:hypothetical protein [candidate division WOR-3 bacterium]
MDRLFRQQEFTTEPNAPYPDPTTGRAREIDLVARWTSTTSPSEVNALVLCECENNSQPVVFFGTPADPERDMDESYVVSGFPLGIDAGAGVPTHLASLHGSNRDLHSYGWPLATQYCTFKPPKRDNDGRWMALHNDEQHDTLEALRQATCCRVEAHYQEMHGMLVSLLDPGEWSMAQVYYPVVVLGGEMYLCSNSRGHFSLRKTQHVRFMKQWSGLNLASGVSVGIDIISERHVPAYVRCVRNEVQYLSNLVKSYEAGIVKAIAQLGQKINGDETPAALRRVVERHASRLDEDDTD